MADDDATGRAGGTRLHIVTGKGGTGKTTVAAALALALTRQGKRVLLAEVEGRQGISQTFDIAPLSTQESRIVTDRSGGQLWGLSVDAKTALLEYLQIFYKLGRAGTVLEKVGAIDFATTIAPGVRDVLLIGRVYEAVGRRVAGRGKGGAFVYDAVVLDAPPTGRVVRFLNVNAEVADVAKVGPIRSQADSITAMLQSPTTAVHVVTLLEEMPVQETLDALPEIRRIGIALGSLIVNLVREPLLADRDLATLTSGRTGRMRTRLKADLKTAGLAPDDAVLDGLLVEASEHADRVALQRTEVTEIEAVGLPVLRLPALADGTEGGGIRMLADLLDDGGLV